MYRAARILIETLNKAVVADEDAADALYEASQDIADSGEAGEARATLHLARMHRVKAIHLRCQIDLIRLKATLHFMQTRLDPPI